MTDTPAFLKDSKDLLTEQGFATSNVWYHGTSSALIESIQQQGILRSGDQALREATRKTMATIGDDGYTDTTEPVFLTQSKALAWYWARQTVRNRSVRFEGKEEPVVFAVQLPENLNAEIRPDVGAASLLLLEAGEHYLAYLAEIYQDNGFNLPVIDLMKADRMEYLKLLGMAYIDRDIPANHVSLVSNTI
ncbi:hypothetical protein SAMN02745752_00297 [Marinospirillum alkaliphilum DSM 21637]|uniref:Uncharacterized protein n=2 Tax=Marinospirillum TaxID=64968 RepID=A0A1K1TT44_9GAMM|nr:hypothetical protein SAMN02745752_00297 [Marinospirillum alkaliphilum DSM 21637]